MSDFDEDSSSQVRLVEYISSDNECTRTTTWQRCEPGQSRLSRECDEVKRKKEKIDRLRTEAGYDAQSDCSDTNVVTDPDPPNSTAGSSRRDSFSGSAIVQREFDEGGDGRSYRFTILAEPFFADILKSFRRGETRLVRESINFNNTYHVNNEVSKICKRFQKLGTFHLISYHDQPFLHIHVLHACPWRWYQCKCYQPYGRRNVRTEELATIRTEDWYNIFEYYSSDNRILQHVFSRNTHVKTVRGVKFIFPERLPAGAEGDTVADWQVRDFEKFYDDRTPIFQALNGNIDDYYMTPEDSMECIIELLRYQLHNIALAEGIAEDKAVENFLKEVYYVCERQHAKVNTLELIGGANSGKSFFADMVLLWNEANYEKAAEDTIKLLLGGDPCPANIKYQDMKSIARTPVIITANMKVIPNTEPFRARMYRYTWQPCNMLKFRRKKPNPSFLPMLWRYFNILSHD